MNPNGAPMIRFDSLSKTFGTGADKVTALREVNFDILRGDIHGIIGMSGAGKSTLIRLINRIETPTSGRVLIDGQDVMALGKGELNALRRRVSMIFQQFNLLMQRTVLENVRYPMEIRAHARSKALKAVIRARGEDRRNALGELPEAFGFTHRAQNARATELLSIVGLADKANAYPAQLSGGQKQRVAIARALASDPDVLLCDEATSALDPMTTQSILALLQEINRRMGITIVLITHEMAVIRQICNRVTIIDGGVIAEEGTVDEVFTHTQSAAGRRLFGILDEEEPGEERQSAIRIVFEGGNVQKPVIAALVRECGVDVNILSANVKRIGGAAYGQMLIERPKDDQTCQRVLAYLRAQGLAAQEVNG